jgi:undecaprenyl-diphosphatase
MFFSKIILVILLFCLSSNLKAESVFSLDLKKDIAISAFTIGLFASSWFIETPPSQTPDSLTQNDVNPFDRFFMVPGFNSALANISTAAMVVMVNVAPILPVLGNFNWNTMLTYSVMYSQSVLLTFGTRNLLKNNITRFRPYMYDGRNLHDFEAGDHNSFPSGSSSMAFLSATFLSTTFAQEYPDSKWKLPIIIGSYTLAASVGIMRISSKQHFITDVFAGAAIGSFYGWIIPFLHKNNNNNKFAINYIGNGLLVSLSL